MLLVFGDVKDRVIGGEERMETAINAATNVLAGSNKGMRGTLIQLLLRKPNPPDLTTVDLPRITWVSLSMASQKYIY